MEDTKAGTRRLAAIMFTDMVGYSTITEQNEARAIALLEIQSRLMEPILVVHGGRVVRTMGDGIFVEFASAVSACRAALEVQDAITRHNESGEEFHIRIGIHLGDVEVVNDDLLGHGVNIAARIEPFADSDGICVSEDVARQVKGKIGAELENIGSRQLKGIDVGINVYKLVREARLTAHRQTKKALPSVAVLPFANLSPDPENEFFGDGLTEEVIWALSKIRKLAVVSRTSCFALKGTTKPIKEVGKLLGVDHVLEGSVRKAGNRIRITVQLVDIAKDRAVYTDRFDRDLEDIFAIQEEITKSIVDALQIAVSEAEQGAISQIPTRNIKAYEAYMRAMASSWVRPEDAVSHFDKAMALDPDFAKAFAAAAINSLQVVRYFSGGDVSYIERARRTSARALDLDPDLAESHAAVAEVAFHDGHTETAIAEYEAALALDPNSFEVLYHYGRMLYVASKWEECIDAFLRAAEARPDEYQPLALASNAILQLRGEDAFAKVRDEALQRIEVRIRCCPTEARAYVLGSMLYRSVDNKRARMFVERALEIESDPGIAYNAGCFYCLEGEHEKAIEFLELAFEKGFNFANWIRNDHDLKAIIDDPRVQALLTKMDARLSEQ